MICKIIINLLAHRFSKKKGILFYNFIYEEKAVNILIFYETNRIIHQQPVV